jgi:hypothetical protein
MPIHHPTLIGALEELSRRVDVKLDKIADSIGGIQGEQLPVYKKAISDPREEILLCYTVGDLVFTPFRDRKGREVRYGLLDMGLYTLDGHLNGRYRVIWQPNPNVPPTELSQRPPQYSGPWDRVVKPIPKFEMRANSNAEYQFEREGGTVYATGPANLLLVPLDDGSQMFVISVATFITGGTGVFEGCSGVNTALGSSFIPRGTDVLGTPYGQKIPGVTVSTFRVIRAHNVGQASDKDGDQEKYVKNHDKEDTVAGIE